MAAETIDSAVIIDPAFLGDVVFDAPLVRALKAQNPACKVGLVVRPPADAIARSIAGVDRVHIFDKKNKDAGFSGLKRVAAELRAEHYAVALIPHPSVRSTALAYFAGVPKRRGDAPGLFARAFLTEHLRSQKTDSFVRARLRLLDANAPVELAGTFREPPVPKASKPRIGLVLGSQWATKRWAPERASEFVRALDPARAELVLIGAESERALYTALGPLPGAIDAIGGTVDDLLHAIAACDVVIAGDTGPLHIARAYGIPVVALFGPTPESRIDFAPHDRLLTVDLSCRPCSAHGGHTCPEGHHRCMRELSAERVLEATNVLLGAAR
jgi:heptosyltransferase-2